MQEVFSIGEALSFGWTKLKENSAVLLSGSVIIFALNLISSWASKSFEDGGFGIIGLLLVIASIIVSIGYMIISLKVSRGEAVSIKDIIPPGKIGFNVFLVSILAGIIVVAGLILLIIPGIYLALRFMMTSYAVVDGAGIKESFSRSTHLTDGHKWQLLGFCIVLCLVNILGAIPFGLGLLVTTPITAVAAAHVYNKLKHAHHAAHGDHAEHSHA